MFGPALGTGVKEDALELGETVVLRLTGVSVKERGHALPFVGTLTLTNRYLRFVGEEKIAPIAVNGFPDIASGGRHPEPSLHVKIPLADIAEVHVAKKLVVFHEVHVARRSGGEFVFSVGVRDADPIVRALRG